MQTTLFHDSIADALRETVQCVGGFKVVGLRLWPEMPADHAAGKLRDCLNHDRRERLSPEQLLLLLRLGREHGCHSAMHYLASESGYTTPQPLEPADERAELQRAYIESARHMARLADRIERLSAPEAVPVPPSQIRRHAA